jgi:Cu2+-exporting ATPase
LSQLTTTTSSSSAEDISPGVMLQLAAAVERQATHPVAKALVAAAAADRQATAASSSSSSSEGGSQQSAEQQQLLQQRRDSHAAAGTSSSSSADGKHHLIWQHKHSSSKGSNSSSSSSEAAFLSPEAAAVLAGGGQLEPDSGTFTQEPGSGAVAVVAGHKVSVGTLEWVRRHGAQLGTIAEQRLQANSSSSSSGSGSGSNGSIQHDPLTGHTQVYVGVDDVVVGLVDVADVIRPDARSTIQELHDQGITTVMLSGGASARQRFAAKWLGGLTVCFHHLEQHSQPYLQPEAILWFDQHLNLLCANPMPSFGHRRTAWLAWM